MAAIQIAPVAARAGVAAGTVYRYFPGKIELVAALVESVAEREIEAVRRAADAAPGPLSALAAAITTFGARALRDRKLALAVIAEPVETDIDAVRRITAATLAAEFEPRIRAAIEGGHLPDQDADSPRRSLLGALIEGLIGPLAPRPPTIRRFARSGADADTVCAARARRGRCPRPRPCGADRAAGRRRRGLLQRRRRDPVGDGAERAGAAFALAASRYTASCASAEVPPPTMARQRCNLGEAAERLGVGATSLDHPSSISATVTAPLSPTNVPCTP